MAPRMTGAFSGPVAPQVPVPAAAGRVVVHRPQKSSAHARPERRGGFLLYVPEAWDGTSDLPLVVALHGTGPDATGGARALFTQTLGGSGALEG